MPASVNGDGDSKEKAPVYSTALLALIGVTGFSTPAKAISKLEQTVSKDGQPKFPNGAWVGKASELIGVCVTTISDFENYDEVEVLLNAAQNTLVPDVIRISDTLVLTLDDVEVDHHDIDRLKTGTRLYAKRLIVRRQVDAPKPDEIGPPPKPYWRLLIGEFLTLKAISRMEDWTKLP